MRIHTKEWIEDKLIEMSGMKDWLNKDPENRMKYFYTDIHLTTYNFKEAAYITTEGDDDISYEFMEQLATYLETKHINITPRIEEYRYSEITVDCRYYRDILVWWD